MYVSFLYDVHKICRSFTDIVGYLLDHKKWVKLKKEDCAIYMSFTKLSYYLYAVQATIKCDFSLYESSKVNNWGNKVVDMLQVKYDHIKGLANILAH